MRLAVRSGVLRIDNSTIAKLHGPIPPCRLFSFQNPEGFESLPYWRPSFVMPSTVARPVV